MIDLTAVTKMLVFALRTLLYAVFLFSPCVWVH